MRLTGRIKRTAARNQRARLLGALIEKNGLIFGAEIGVADGRLCRRLLTAYPRLQMLAVDYWPADDPERILRQIKRRILFGGVLSAFAPRLSLLDLPSIEAAALVPDGSLDFAFIDADHRYEHVRADIQAWRPKIRPGGFLTGHDYHRKRFAGVVQAVNEAFKPTILGETIWSVRL